MSHSSLGLQLIIRSKAQEEENILQALCYRHMGELYLGQENILSTKLEQMCVITKNLTVLMVQVKVKLANRKHFLPDNNSYTWSSTPDTDTDQLAIKVEKKNSFSIPVSKWINPNNRISFWVIRIFLLNPCDIEIL